MLFLDELYFHLAEASPHYTLIKLKKFEGYTLKISNDVKKLYTKFTLKNYSLPIWRFSPMSLCSRPTVCWTYWHPGIHSATTVSRVLLCPRVNNTPSTYELWRSACQIETSWHHMEPLYHSKDYRKIPFLHPPQERKSLNILHNGSNLNAAFLNMKVACPIPESWIKLINKLGELTS